MNILSIQSTVALGHVGNSAATFPLQRLGFEVWPVATAMLAHHPGHGAWRGRMSTAEELRVLFQGIEDRGGFAACDAVLSGYLGDPALAPAVRDAIRKVRRMNPRAIYCCDPVMGDREKGFYVRPGIPEFFRDQALALADILIPNDFELAYLADRRVEDLATALDAARSLIARGPRLVLATGLKRRIRGRLRIGAMAVTARRAWHAESPWMEAPASGAGDAFAAFFLGHYLKSRNAAKALGMAVSSIHAVLAKTAAAGASELSLIAAQDAFIAPKRLFKASEIS